MDSGLIPQRYAKALYKYAVEQGQADAMYQTAKTVIEQFEKNPDLHKVISNPYVKTDDKEQALIAAAGNTDDDVYNRFIKMIIELHREQFAYLMMLAYRDLYRKENNIAKVNITTATQLDAAIMQKLHALVVGSFPKMTLEFSELTDPEIIGGFVIDVDSVRMDASVSNELEQLRQTLLRSK